MKTLKVLNCTTAFLFAALVTAVSQPADPATDKPKAANEIERDAKIDAATPDENSTASPAAASKPKATPDGTLRLNFRGVPVAMVLDYLSDAAGFIIIKETEVKGKVDAWSNQPLTKDEAVDLLNTILNKNDYAAIRNGRTLTIVSKDEAKKRDIPVVPGGEAVKIPK